MNIGYVIELVALSLLCLLTIFKAWKYTDERRKNKELSKRYNHKDNSDCRNDDNNRC